MFCFDYTAEKSKEKLCFDDLAQSERIRNVLLWRTKIWGRMKKNWPPKNVCELQYQMHSIFSATLNTISIFCLKPSYNLMFFNLSDLNDKRFLYFLNQQTYLLRNALLQVNLTRKRMFFEKKEFLKFRILQVLESSFPFSQLFEIRFHFGGRRDLLLNVNSIVEQTEF